MEKFVERAHSVWLAKPCCAILNLLGNNNQVADHSQRDNRNSCRHTSTMWLLQEARLA